MLTGFITNIQKYSIQDGPGIRTTVFLKGCPLDCWWCHNPEGRSAKAEVVVVETRCIHCGECVKACPEDGISLEAETPVEADISDSGETGTKTTKKAMAETKAFFSHPTAAECRICGACVEACPTGARQMSGRSLTTEEVLAEI